MVRAPPGNKGNLYMKNKTAFLSKRYLMIFIQLKR